MSGPESIKDQVEKARAEAERKAGAKKAGTGKAGASRRKPGSAFPFKIVDGYLCRSVEAEGSDDGKRWAPFVTPLRVLARTRTRQGEGHGLLLEVIDLDGVAHSWAMPMGLLAGTGDQVRAVLLGLGLRPAPGAGRRWKEWLQEFLFLSHPEDTARSVHSIGWHGETFVLPDETFGPEASKETAILQTDSPMDHAFGQAGTMESWKADVAGRAQGNSRLVLAIASAFSAPLLAVVGEDGGGFHLRGGSSIGKSSALHVAGSVWGGGGPGGYVRNWRARSTRCCGLWRPTRARRMCPRCPPWRCRGRATSGFPGTIA